MIKALKRLNEALPGLLLGIAIYGLIVEFAGVWFVSDKLRYTSGLWIGIACAMGMGIHLAMVIEEAVRMGRYCRVRSAYPLSLFCAIWLWYLYFLS